MSEWLTRTETLLGARKVEKLKNSSVAVFGVGGVGSYVCEALVRAGIGSLTFVDGDTVNESNLNRQLIALRSTLSMKKADVMKARALDINPDADVAALGIYFTKETAAEFDFSHYDYVADAIDMVSSKLLLAEMCRDTETSLLSCMGTGNKLDPTAFRVCDIYETSGDPLARVMRRELKKRGIFKLNVVFSPEEPLKSGSGVIGTVPYVPAAAGLILAGKIISDLTEGE